MSMATLTFSGWDWLWPIAGVMGVALLLLVWSYRATPTGWARWGCVGFKVLGLAALAICLLEPLWSGQRARPGANLFAILADNSQGLQRKDRHGRLCRGGFPRGLANPQAAGWRGRTR